MADTAIRGIKLKSRKNQVWLGEKERDCVGAAVRLSWRGGGEEEEGVCVCVSVGEV
jgi:hypothetical protein